jgi:hypothetical protein
MAQFYFSVNLDNDRVLCIAPLTDRRIATATEEIQDTSGYFLFERRESSESSIDVIAHLASEDAAFRLRELLGMN